MLRRNQKTNNGDNISNKSQSDEIATLIQTKVLDEIKQELPAIISGCLQNLQDKKTAEETAVQRTLSQIASTFEEMKKDLQEIKNSQNFISAKFDELNDRIERNTSTGKSNEVMLEKQKAEINKLNTSLKDMTTKYEETDRISRLEMLEFHGIPKCDTEDAGKLVRELASTINVTIEDREIAHAYRKFSKNDSKPPPIVAKFCSRTVRNKIYQSRSNLRYADAHTSSTIPEPSKVFIVENLSEKNRDLFYKARLRKKEYNYLFLWTKNGKIFAQKSKETSTLQIKSEDDLEKMR